MMRTMRRAHTWSASVSEVVLDLDSVVMTAFKTSISWILSAIVFCSVSFSPIKPENKDAI